MSKSWSSWCAALVVLISGCKEASQPVSLTTVVTEAPGQNCAAGGVAILVGVDADADGAVSATEAKSTSYVCSGQVGKPGSLVRVATEAAGANCEFGGHQVVTGPDTNGNGTLEDSEGTSTQYLCDAAGGATSLLKKTAGAPADTTCPGGWVRLAFGADDDGNGTLETAEEETVFVTCNLAPTVTMPQVITVPNCAQAFTLPITFADVDGTVAGVTARVLASGSTISLTVDANNRVVIAGGMHVGAAMIEVTATDDLGGRTVLDVQVLFEGTGCLPDFTFYGVNPATCVGIDVNDLAGDDRSGPVLTARGAYYNGDEGLVLVTVDAMGAMDAGLLVNRAVDGLMGDVARGELLSLWSSTWSADGGSFDAGLLDAPAEGYVQSVLDEVAVIDEATFQPTRRVALPAPVTATFTVTDTSMTQRTFPSDNVLVAAAEGHALVALYGGGQTDRAIRYMLVDTTTGAVVLDRSVILATGTANINDWPWATQEDEIQHYALTRRGTAFWLTYKASSYRWFELELATGTPILRTESFAANCDVQNLAMSANGREVWLHSEGDCFDVFASEGIIRCSTLRTTNLDGGVNDTGGENNPEGR